MQLPPLDRRRLPPRVKKLLKAAARVADVPNRGLYRLTHRDGPPFPPWPVRAQVAPVFRPSAFFAGGRAVADDIARVFAESGHPLGDAASVLDLACGSGRVVMHLAARHPSTRFAACDVDHVSVAWAARNVRGVDFRASAFRPPLPFETASFDRVFSFSLWTHLGEADQLLWLGEVARVLRPGGVALITTHGAGFHEWMRTSDDAFIESDAFMTHLRAAGPLAERGIVFVSYERPGGATFDFRGIDGDYGMSFQTAEWTRATWSPVVDVLSVEPSAVSDQDAVVVRPKAS